MGCPCLYLIRAICVLGLCEKKHLEMPTEIEQLLFNAQRIYCCERMSCLNLNCDTFIDWKSRRLLGLIDFFMFSVNVILQKKVFILQTNFNIYPSCEVVI